jgi:hypothetical protein
MSCGPFVSFQHSQQSWYIDHPRMVMWLLCCRPLPTILSELTHLTQLDVSGNKLTGTLAPVAALTQLSVLLVSENEFSGNLSSLTALTLLTDLQFFFNRLHGELAPLAPLTRLTRLYCFWNHLTGHLEGLKDLTRLTDFECDSNFGLSGNLSIIAYFPELRALNLSSNRFTGDLSPLASASQLTALYLIGNSLTGEALPVLRRLTRLQIVDLSFNLFSDNILALDESLPCHNLQRFLLANNRFTTNVDIGLSFDFRKFPTLIELDLSGNSGFINAPLALTFRSDDQFGIFAARIATPDLGFACPLPAFPSAMLTRLDHCQPSFAIALNFAGILIGAVVLGVAVVWVWHLHTKSWFLSFVAVVGWLLSFSSAANDLYFLSTVVQDVAGRVSNCHVLNSRGVFLPFLTYTDSLQVSANLTLFMNADGTGYTQSAPPPPTQSFLNFIDVFALYESDAAVNETVAAFQALCLRFQRCQLVRTDSISLAGSSVPALDSVAPIACGPRFDDARWDKKQFYIFLLCVVALIVWKSATELVKLGVVLACSIGFGL